MAPHVNVLVLLNVNVPEDGGSGYVYVHEHVYEHVHEGVIWGSRKRKTP